MALSRRAAAALLTLALLPGLLYGALRLGAGSAEAQSVPVAASPNVELVTVRPGTAAISGVFSRTAPFFYTSGADSLSVFDVSDPENPALKGKLVNAVFENEAMTLGERLEADGSVRRFVLIGNDLANATVAGDGPAHVGRFGGKELIVVDVTDPASPHVAGRTPSTGPGAATTSTHTVACVNAACSLAYTAGGREGTFSILDLSDLAHPKQVKEVASPAAGPNAVFTTGAGHHWNIDGSGIAWHTGSGGATAFDISDPLNPVPVNATDADGIKPPYNDFIHHNAQRPNARAFRPGAEPSVVNGNVLLVTEEDYANDGDELACDKAGTFQTWQIPDLDGAAYRARNPKGEPSKGDLKPLDTINPPNEAGGGLSTPAGGFCSAHWFDYHQSGIVAEGFYQQGLRLIDVRDPRNLKQFGFFTGGGGEVWDAYWAPQRDATGAAVPGKKTNLVYTVDAARGLEVFKVTDLPPDLPVSGDEGARGAFPAPPQTVAQAARNAAQPPRCGAPESALTRASRVTRAGLRLRGTARGRGCTVTKVRVAVARKTGSGCRFLRPDGTFAPRASCDVTRYLTARGTTRWTLTRRLRLPKGSYLVWSRAIDSAGGVERKAGGRNLLRAGVAVR